MIKIERKHMYFVWTKTGHVPRRMHSTYASAVDEAKRLAELCPGKKFIVLHGRNKFSFVPEAETSPSECELAEALTTGAAKCFAARGEA